MARVSEAVKAKYTRVHRPDGNDALCFYCDQAGVIDDMTPSPQAKSIHLAAFRDTWTIVKTCRKCWGRIYSANSAGDQGKFGAYRGCMTMDQKRRLMGSDSFTVMAQSPYVINHDLTRALPADIMKLESGDYVMDGISFHENEIRHLQGPLSCRVNGLPENIVELTFSAAMSLGFLDTEREMRYRKILGLGEPKPW